MAVLAFPCNQFKEQEPDDIQTIVHRYHTEYGITFPILDKIHVNGPDAHPLYQFLRQQKPVEDDPTISDIQWNFTKFLIDPSGRVIRRFEPAVTPEEIDPVVATLF